MSHPKKPELKFTGNVAENFENFEMRFHGYCKKSEHRDLSKNPETENPDHYKKPIIEISALRWDMPDEALQVIRDTIEPQIPDVAKQKPWVWMGRLGPHPFWLTGPNSGSQIKAHLNRSKIGRLASYLCAGVNDLTRSFSKQYSILPTFVGFPTFRKRLNF